MKDNIFDGKRVVLVGPFFGMPKSDVKKLLIECGASVVSGVTTQTNFLLHGRDAGGKKLAKAQSFGVSIMNEAQMLKMFDYLGMLDRTSIADIVSEMKTRILELFPDLESFTPGSAEAIDAFESEFSKSLHPELRLFFELCDFPLSFEGGVHYLGFANVCEAWRAVSERHEEGEFENFTRDTKDDGLLREVFWSERWMPFAIGVNRLLCVDHDPGPNGTDGQVNWIKLEDTFGPYPTARNTIGAYLGTQLDLLKLGTYRISEFGVFLGE